MRMEIPEDIRHLAPEQLLSVVDYLVGKSHRVEVSHLTRLESLLSEGGSVWRATPEGLEQRVDSTLRHLSETVAERPAKHLGDAWHKAWGRAPDASGAYREAVRAVEAAYVPIVSPENDGATLGSMIANIRDNPARFRVRLQAESSNANVGRLRATLQLLWKSQADRHGTPDPNIPLSVSIDEARDAVALATTLVHLVQQGGFSAGTP